MSELLDVDGAAYRFLRQWYALWFLGLLWLAFCVPVVTAFAATRAAVVLTNRLRETDTLPTAGAFVRELRTDFATTTLSGLMLAVVGTMLLGDLALVAQAPPLLAALGLCVFVPLCLMWGMTAAVHATVVAQDEGRGPVAVLKASYVLASTRPLVALGALGVVATCAAVAFVSPAYTQPVAALTAAGCAFHLVSRLASPLISTHARSRP